MKLLKSGKIAKQIKEQIFDKVSMLASHHFIPQLRILWIGDDSSSEWFINSKIKLAEKLGIAVDVKRFSDNVLERDVENVIYEFNRDPQINGILISLPLPPTFDKVSQKRLLNRINPYKDVDCVTWKNRGGLFTNRPDVVLPATIQSCMMLAESVEDISKKNVTFVGTGNVGAPLYSAMINKYPTFESISICNKYTKNLIEEVKKANLIFSAVGKPWLITGDMISPNTIIIDAGITKVGLKNVNGKVRDKYVGDVDISSLNDVECTVTPTPGGVGTLTTTMIMNNLMNTQSTLDKISYHLGRRGGF